MDLKNITDLISIRLYVITAIESNAAISRPTLKRMTETLALLDKKIIDLITGPEFGEYIGYSEVKQVMADVAKLNDIRSGLKR